MQDGVAGWRGWGWNETLGDAMTGMMKGDANRGLGLRIEAAALASRKELVVGPLTDQERNCLPQKRED
jgi:hypothetical protein